MGEGIFKIIYRTFILTKIVRSEFCSKLFIRGLDARAGPRIYEHFLITTYRGLKGPRNKDFQQKMRVYFFYDLFTVVLRPM